MSWGIMKYLLWIAFFLVVLLLVRKAQGNRSRRQAPPARAPERMVTCAHCHVNQPLSESILSNGRYYCCPAHQHEGKEHND